MRKSKFFRAEKLFDNVTAIAGLAGELCFLVEGSEKALLIDTLVGVGSLKAYVRELTDLPVQVVNTHGHLDHCGGNFEYGACYLHPADIGLLYNHSDPAGRLAFAKQGALPGGFQPLPEDVVPPCPLKTYPVYDGDVFDLGGVSLEVIGVPGHSRGAIVLLDRARRVVYSGDACNCNTLLFIEGATSIEEYKESLLHFKTFQPDFDVMYGGHGLVPVPKEIIDDAVSLCEEIMAGTDDGEPGETVGRPCLYAKKKRPNFTRLDGGLANIAYRKDGIWKNGGK